MKTYIIQLENHDDFVSARDKMSWAKGGRILLVWPARGHLLNRRLDLKLLQRAAAGLGAQLALVSQDTEVLYHGPRLGIPVFRSLRKAQNKPWRLSRRFRFADASIPPFAALAEPRPNSAAGGTSDSTAAVVYQSPAERLRAARPHPIGTDLKPAARLAWFALGVMALLTIAAVLVPSAAVQFTPQTQVQDVVVEVWTQPGATDSGLSGSLPSQWITARVEGRDHMPASGSMLIAERAALGEVEFTNLTEHEVKIPEGTVVLTTEEPRIRFAVTRPGSLQSGPGATLLLPIKALDPGPVGNLAANRLTAIEGALGVEVSANNPQPTHSGSARETPAPTSANRRLLAEHLQATLAQSALAEMRSRIAPGDAIITDSLQLETVLDESYTPEEGLPADQLSLSQRLEYRALVVSAADMQRLAATIFDTNLAAGFAPKPDSLQVEMVTDPQLDPALGKEFRYRWTLHAARRMVAQVAEAQAVRLALGRSPDSARQALQAGLSLEKPPEIQLQPVWWPRLPVLPFRIRVTPQAE